jgi:osmotically-inducible protein OsmY
MPDDIRLEKAVLNALNAEPRIIPAHIGVMVNDGVVTLTGHVETLPEKHFAEMAASHVTGVKGVAEEIQVRLSTVSNRTDDEIAAAAINHLSWTTLVPQNAIKVMVEGGWITLTGEVPLICQKEAAEQNVHQLYGVVGVSNQINIRQPSE